ncbi:MAG: hypothetical protein PVF49_01410 [Anaerolineales bacterium]|jgi:hypothetical protein
MNWWQRWAGRVFDLAKRLLDDSQPAEKMRAFLRASLQEACASGPGASQEASFAQDLAARLKLATAAKGTPAAHPKLASPSEFLHWRENLSDERVLTRSGLAPGAGLMLLSILDDPGRHATFLQSQLELLLRRVEVKRRAALETAGQLDPQAEWLERHAVAILFSRAARQTRDLRYLNAALKLNDWAFHSHKNLQAGPRLDRYLWALAEQETSWKELLG